MSQPEQALAALQIKNLYANSSVTKAFKLTAGTSTYDEMPEQLNFGVMLIWRYNEFTAFLIQVCLVL